MGPQVTAAILIFILLQKSSSPLSQSCVGENNMILLSPQLDVILLSRDFFNEYCTYCLYNSLTFLAEISGYVTNKLSEFIHLCKPKKYTFSYFQF